MTLEFDVTSQLGSFSYQAAFNADREIVVLFGHSGAGKSLTLQFVAGLLRPSTGRIAIDGACVFDSSRSLNVAPQHRRAGYVVQELALFEHMTVAENVAFGVPRGVDRRQRVRELLSFFELDGFGERRPRTLSGGQRQRVALARAIARDAPVLLLDEPFSALDDALRTSLRRELLRLRAELGLTILFVTHDLREAHFLADRIAVFDEGALLQVDAREQVFKRPSSRRVAQLTGGSNIWSGHVAEVAPGSVVVEVQGLRLRSSGSPAPVQVGQPVDVVVRPERINLHRGAPAPGEKANIFSARVVAEYAYGSTHTLHLEPTPAGPSMEVEIAARPYEVLGVATRKEFSIEIDAGDVHVIPA